MSKEVAERTKSRKSKAPAKEPEPNLINKTKFPGEKVASLKISKKDNVSDKLKSIETPKSTDKPEIGDKAEGKEQVIEPKIAIKPIVRKKGTRSEKLVSTNAISNVSISKFETMNQVKVVRNEKEMFTDKEFKEVGMQSALKDRTVSLEQSQISKTDNPRKKHNDSTASQHASDRIKRKLCGTACIVTTVIMFVTLATAGCVMVLLLTSHRDTHTTSATTFDESDNYTMPFPA